MTEVLEETQLKYPHVVRAALDFEVTSESSSWQLADALVEDIGAEPPGSAGVNTGLEAKCEEAYLEVKEAGGRELKPRTLRQSYRVAVAWPAETRVPAASYSAHRELSAAKWDGKRQGKLQRIADRSSDGWVSRKDVQLWKSGLVPAKVVPFLDQIERRVRTAVKKNPWQTVAEGDRRAIAQILYAVAGEIERGEFK